MNPPSTSSIAATNASVLLLLFAKEITAPAQQGNEGPRTGKHVTVMDLASLELAWAFWTLRNRGCVVLEPYDRPERFRIFFKRSRPTVGARIGGAAADPGVEDELLKAIGPDAEGSDVSDVVYRWIGQDSDSPSSTVTARIASKAIELGYFKVVDAGRGTIGRIIKGKTKVEPVPEAIAAARPAFDECFAQWRRFESGEADLHRVLLAACDHGIDRRYKSDSDAGRDY
jgi:hypothetical protein